MYSDWWKVLHYGRQRWRKVVVQWLTCLWHGWASQIAPSLYFKARLSVNRVQIKLIFTWKILHLASFWRWEFSELGSGLLKIPSVNDIRNKSYMNCGNEMKMKKWSSQWTQFMQLRKEAWKKFRTSTGFEPVTWKYPVYFLINIYTSSTSLLNFTACYAGRR